MRALLRLAYDGTEFAGCPALPGERTVCGVLGEAFGRVGEAPTLVETLSRTDAGVHAVGNVGHVVLSRAWTAVELLLMLDRHLPADLRCTGVALVDGVPDVQAKTYSYALDRTRWGDPALRRTAWRPPASLDDSVLDELAVGLVGTRDWSGFRRSGETRDDLVRTIHAAGWASGERFTIRGDGFAFRMVRALVGGMVAVASGAASRADWERALAGEVTSASRQTAPARGLRLESIEVGVDWVS